MSLLIIWATQPKYPRVQNVWVLGGDDWGVENFGKVIKGGG